ncbi:MAG TPA: hypothetical protein VHY34_01510 [Caulobacteraceae bacterium]|nr:hypothetical protein [Caulobacteraceae bacterium]
MIAPDSKMLIGSPPSAGSWSISTGMRWFGFIFRKPSVNWSPRPMLQGVMR